jgi:hypothetical protein
VSSAMRIDARARIWSGHDHHVGGTQADSQDA